MFNEYSLAMQAFAAAIVLLGVQGMLAASIKAARPGAVPGKIDASLGHESLVFRSHRTFMNALENYPFFIGSWLLALFAGADAFWVGVLSWAFVAGRAGHMLCYYRIATEKNPSPRSYFYMLALLASWGVTGLALVALL